jgi:hypothetical protein
MFCVIFVQGWSLQSTHDVGNGARPIQYTEHQSAIPNAVFPMPIIDSLKSNNKEQQNVVH